MSESRRHYFSLHELLIMAALAALGGVSSALLSMLREMSHAGRANCLRAFTCCGWCWPWD